MTWRRTRLALSVHVVWSVRDREPMLATGVRERVWARIAAAAEREGARAVAVGGVEDHVHVLLRLPATVTLARVIKRLKGSSSHLINAELSPGRRFRWQRGYSASSLWPRDEAVVAAYIRDQPRHHRSGEISTDLERAVPRGRSPRRRTSQT